MLCLDCKKESPHLIRYRCRQCYTRYLLALKHGFTELDLNSFRNCSCGCGRRIQKINSRGELAKFLYGHNNRGIKWSVNIRNKLASSVKRYHELAHPKQNKSCGYCKKKYIVTYADRDRKYCSLSCYHKNNRRENNSSWKGGLVLQQGYVMLKLPSGVYKKRARIIMEEFLNRKLFSHDIVHHINGDKADDRIENLQLMTRKEHINLHHH